MTVKIIETQSNFEEMTSLLEEAKDTLKHITESEEWETLIQGSSADIVVEKIDKYLKENKSIRPFFN
jgi:hypothetical protein|tara:strand:+ start:222 stop:422 length:201 start_codon:yes stop_codon:yes gene_type:complete